MDIFGSALLDYQEGNYIEDIITFSSLDEKDVLPLPYLFRDFESMPPMEQKALDLCKGSVLDIGCGSGSHCLYLQQQGLSITALDSSRGAIKTCKLRGIKNTVHTDLYAYNEKRFDTLLLLMNGLGVAENRANLNRFLSQVKSLLLPNGQILLDSSDIIYMCDEETNQDLEGQSGPISGAEKYYGDVTYVMEYKKRKSEPFQWLYLDFTTLKRVALTNGLSCDLVMQGEHYDYLARLSLL